VSHAGGGSASEGSAAGGKPPGSRWHELPWLARLALRVLLAFALVGAGIALMQVSRIPGIVVVVIGLLSVPILYPRDRRRAPDGP
jgi:hypothetical protein